MYVSNAREVERQKLFFILGYDIFFYSAKGIYRRSIHANPSIHDFQERSLIILSELNLLCIQLKHYIDKKNNAVLHVCIVRKE